MLAVPSIVWDRHYRYSSHLHHLVELGVQRLHLQGGWHPTSQNGLEAYPLPVHLPVLLHFGGNGSACGTRFLFNLIYTPTVSKQGVGRLAAAAVHRLMKGSCSLAGVHGLALQDAP